MDTIGKLARVENNRYLVHLDKGKSVNVGDFLKIKDNVGIVKGIILENSELNLVMKKEESMVFTPDYLDEIATIIDLIIIDENILSNDLGDEAFLMKKEEIEEFHIKENKFRINYLHLLDDRLKLKVLNYLKQEINDPIIDILIDDIEWKLKMQ